MSVHGLNGAEPLPIIRGSVLAIPLPNKEWAMGIVISPGTKLFIGFPIERFSDPVHAEDIQNKALRLFSWTNDAEVFRGNWNLIGLTEVPDNLPLPEYKVFVEGKEMIESFDGKSLRPFGNCESSSLTFRKVRSPLLVQDAVYAALGLGDWKQGYQDMLL